MIVCIDPGHGGSDPGAVGKVPFRLQEKDVTLAVSLFLHDELLQLGHTVILTRKQDRTLSLSARAAFANRFNADLFVSIHANAAASVTPEGMEVFHFPGSARGQFMASRILDRMLEAFPGHKNRGVKEANFAVLRLSRMPAVLVELEFLTHPEQLRFLADEANQRRLANAIAGGIHPGF
jgi:N-acetylmuramoyl-L-alanine amidase